MKVLTIIGSFRKNGNTSQIARLIESGLEKVAAEHQEPLEIETVFLGDLNMLPCRGCRACFDRGEEKCPCRDDFLALKAKMKAADAILVGSPVYLEDVSGIVKTWIDRLAHVSHRPEFAGKCVYLVATTGRSRTSKTLETLSMAIRIWGFHLVGKTGFKMGASMKPQVSQERFQAEAEAIARSLFDAVHRRLYARPSFFSLVVFRIQQLAWQSVVGEDTIDYQYWKNRGWLDPGCSFYIPHEANPVKVALARLTGTLLRPFVA